MVRESNLPSHLSELVGCLQKFDLTKIKRSKEKIKRICQRSYYTHIPINVREVLYPIEIIIDYYVPLMLNRIAIKLIDKFKMLKLFTV